MMITVAITRIFIVVVTNEIIRGRNEEGSCAMPMKEGILL